jgi:hypothetical protein
MPEPTNALIYEVLNDLQQKMGGVELRLDEVKAELAGVRSHVLGIQQDVANIYGVLRHRSLRLDRIERRLSIIDVI